MFFDPEGPPPKGSRGRFSPPSQRKPAAPKWSILRVELETAFEHKKADEANGYNWRCSCRCCKPWVDKPLELIANLNIERGNMLAALNRAAAKESEPSATPQAAKFAQVHGDLVPKARNDLREALAKKDKASRKHKDRSKSPLSGLGGGGKAR